MSQLFTNDRKRADFFGNALTEGSRGGPRVLIAVAFFTHAQPILDMVAAGCRTKLIVRLGYPTSPDALRSVVGVEGLQVRYIASDTFHPKLYVFEGRCALVGSSNLTRQALLTNQEINVSIPIEDERYDDLVSVFSEYWRQVRVLDAAVIDSYARIFDKYRDVRASFARMEQENKALSSAQIGNIDRGPQNDSSVDVYLHGYRTTYQEFLDAFRTVARIYSSMGLRKHPEFPLRLEIDNCLSWIRDNYTEGDSYLAAPLLHGTELELKVRETLSAWFAARYRWFEEEVVPVRYPRILATLGSAEAIANATYEELVAALACENSFYDRLRFFKGGHEAHVALFMSENKLERVRKTLTYLLFDREDPIARMARCIFDADFRLNHFGRSAVQELVGWINADDIPVCNNRTLRSLRWLGFDVELVGG